MIRHLVNAFLALLIVAFIGLAGADVLAMAAHCATRADEVDCILRLAAVLACCGAISAVERSTA